MEKRSPLSGDGVLVRRDERRVLAFLAAVCAASWACSLRMAADVGGAGPHPQHRAVWPLALMWAGMMVAMMVPPEVPRVLWLWRAHRQQRRDPLLHSLAFLVGYLAPWMLASLGAALLQARLGAAGLLTEDMATGSRMLAGLLLLAAGAVQLSPFKRLCLERCRAPPFPGRLGKAALPPSSAERAMVPSPSARAAC